MAKVSVGSVLGERYLLEELVGEGGFGRVYRARQLSLDREVAVKVLSEHLLTDVRMRQRFLREARVIKGLRHPNTIQIFDFGECASGVMYLVMEFLYGLSLSDILARQGSLQLCRVLRISEQILKSLHEAHSFGIVHRDLKPENIFIQDILGEPDYVKVLDFGLAKSFDFASSMSIKLTLEGTAMGTPLYVAPEVLRKMKIGAYTDIYSLGLMMYEMLAGKRLILGDNRLGVCAHLAQEAFDLKEVSEFPLCKVIARAVEKDYRRRYQSCIEMLHDLKGLNYVVREDVIGAKILLDGRVLGIEQNLSSNGIGGCRKSYGLGMGSSGFYVYVLLCLVVFVMIVLNAILFHQIIGIFMEGEGSEGGSLLHVDSQ